MAEFYKHHVAMDNLATLMVIEHPEVGARFGGAFADAHGSVRKFSKAPVPGLKGWHYIGVMALSSKVFQYCSPTVRPENILYDVLSRGMQAHERVGVFPTEVHWFEVGNPKDFINATNAVLDLIEEQPDEAWVRSLLQRIRWARLQEPLVEACDSRTLGRVQRFLQGF